MDRIAWDPALESGDDTVDTQHRELIDMLNRLSAAEDEPGSVALIPETLEALSAYVSTHFACEHALMEKHRMPQAFIEMHEGEHRSLTGKTRDFVLRYRQGEVDSVLPLVDFLHEWLVEHIQRVDRELVELMREA